LLRNSPEAQSSRDASLVGASQLRATSNGVASFICDRQLLLLLLINDSNEDIFLSTQQ
jgi:hypothetical protein